LRTNCSIGEALPLGAFQGQIGTGFVVNAQLGAGVVPEVEFGGVAGEMVFGAVLVNPNHPPLEDAVEAFNGVGVDFPAPVFACVVGVWWVTLS
jgi:hypothetical protein